MKILYGLTICTLFFTWVSFVHAERDDVITSLTRFTWELKQYEQSEKSIIEAPNLQGESLFTLEFTHPPTFLANGMPLTYGGRVACNQFAGGSQVGTDRSGRTVKFAPPDTTSMACGYGVYDSNWQKRYSQVLEVYPNIFKSLDRFEISGSKLKLFSAQGKGSLLFAGKLAD